MILPTVSLPDFSAPQSPAEPASFFAEWGNWLYALVGLAAAIAVAVVVHWLLFRTLRALLADGKGDLEQSLLKRARRPVMLVLCVMAVRLLLPTLKLPADVGEPLEQGLGIAVTVTIAWLCMMALQTVEWLIARRHDMQARDNLQARRVNTQVRILRRSLNVVVFVVALAAVLMTFPRVQQLGASLLASAGIAGLVVGLAARPAVENLISGLQLAFTEPIRLDDVVIIQGEWGRIEEITATYVVVRIWDERRLVVPFSKFLQEPFENWTRTNAQILGTVFVRADFRVPVEEVRTELTRIVKGCEQWDGRVCGLQVTGSSEQTVELRALVSAANASAAFDLRCIVRERLLQFLQQQHPDSLPRLRGEWQQAATPGGASD